MAECVFCYHVSFRTTLLFWNLDREREEIPGNSCTSTRNSPPHDYQGSHVVPVQSEISITHLSSRNSSSGLVMQPCWKTYKPRKTNPIRMHLSTRRTLYLEGIVIGILFCILRTEVGDSMAFVSFSLPLSVYVWQLWLGAGDQNRPLSWSMPCCGSWGP